MFKNKIRLKYQATDNGSVVRMNSSSNFAQGVLDNYWSVCEEVLKEGSCEGVAELKCHILMHRFLTKSGQGSRATPFGENVITSWKKCAEAGVPRTKISPLVDAASDAVERLRGHGISDTTIEGLITAATEKWKQ